MGAKIPFLKGDIVLIPGNIVGKVASSKVVCEEGCRTVCVSPFANPLYHIWLLLRDKLVFSGKEVELLKLLMTEDKAPTELKAPVYSLLVDNDSRNLQEIAGGEITGAILCGRHRGYKPGALVMLSCSWDRRWAVLADIKSRRCCSYRGLTRDELHSAGYENTYDLIDHLQDQYPNSKKAAIFRTTLTVVQWKNAR